MPTSPRETVLRRYHYDSLDRQTTCSPCEQGNIQRFYCKSRLATEIQDSVKLCIFQSDDYLLAQQQSRGANFNITLLATDHQRSILNAFDRTLADSIAYTPYGHHPSKNGLLSLLGFNGERRDSLTGHYHLGNGYRQFNPVLMRFNSPDSWSPFGAGGLNAYAYCAGDPRNRVDPTGHGPIPRIAALANKALMGVSKKAKATSRPLAAMDDLTEVASSSSQAMDAWSLKRLKINNGVRKYRARLKNQSDVVKANEASRPPQDDYNVSDDLVDIDLSKKAYEHAKKGYGFEQFPDPSKPHYWNDPQGKTLLDVAHFDVTISHMKNRGRKRLSNYMSSYRVNVLRAEYIKNFTGIDLMAIRS
jgi:RHS repeat-associated protein